MNISNKLIPLIFLFVICLQAKAQQVENYRIFNNSLNLVSDSCTFVSNESFNAISFRIKGKEFGNLRVQLPNRIVQISKDDHLNLIEGIQSNLIVLKTESKTFTLMGEYAGEIECILQYVAPLTHHSVAGRRASCEHPEMVMQSTWRQGLPDPVPGRNKTPTEHCIVHHSADGNGNSDYTSLVRAYYTHHTVTNGWDDIGYNYLIANDGTLYAGRDPELSTIDQDNVQGAHFCGKNQKTMGVCIIGEYTSIEPSFAAINTLTTLLTWKLDKEQFIVTDSFAHPTAIDPLLSVIDGHKSGCNTTCPGGNIWEKMASIRQEVHNKLDQCSRVGIMEEEESSWTLFPNPSNGTFKIDFKKPVTATLELFDMVGVKLFSEELLNLSIFNASIPQLQNGIYFLRIIHGKKTTHNKIQIIH